MFEWFVVILLLALLAWRYQWQRTRGWILRELRDAELAYAEKLFKAQAPVVLIAKVDRAYRKRDGVIVLMKLKTRRRLRRYPSDVIELSAQRLALMSQTGESVEMHAYVLVQDLSGRRFAHRVDLLDETAVNGLIERREAILNGDLQPKHASSSALCRGCAYFATACHPDRKRGA
jgi:CRISPR/Cas system-associated exonuclease Cas4 (RecB family)